MQKPDGNGDSSPARTVVVCVLPQTTGREVLDNDKFGPGNRPYLEMKEGRVPARYPDLLQTLSKVQGSDRRRLLFESRRRKMDDIIGNPARQLEWQGIGLSRQ